MAEWQKWLWDGLGWSMFGPLGGILARAMGNDTEQGGAQELDEEAFYPQTRAGDFGLSLMVLLPPVVRADQQVSQPELDFVHYFFVTTFGTEQAQDLMGLLQNIFEQDYSLREVCHQIHTLMDYPSCLEIVHLLFGLAQADGHIDLEEVRVIREISGYIGISQRDFESIQAMFLKGTDALYQILQVDRAASRKAVEQAYQRMCDTHHPDRVGHLGPEFQQLAEEKFRAVTEAYQRIKEDKDWT